MSLVLHHVVGFAIALVIVGIIVILVILCCVAFKAKKLAGILDLCVITVSTAK